jgi:WD40 repeat protein
VKNETMPDERKTSEPKPSKTEKVKDISLPSAVLALDATPDGKILFAACQDGGVFTVDPDSGRSELLGRHESYASGVALLPDGQTLLSAGYDGLLQWHHLADRTTLRKVKAHEFWSWDFDLSDDGLLVASATGRYEAGGYKYEPAPEREPSVKLFAARTGELLRQFSHVPPVQAVAFSPDGKLVAAGNLMGEIRVWETATGEQVSQWTTADLTSWGIIKSHHYLGGVFDMMFHPEGGELFVCGMGPMRDPMAGNGVQRWQRFSWRDGKKLDETHEGESGQGLMEALAFHPSKRYFAMAGRLFQGQWNLAFFDAATGKNLHALDAKHRITDALFTADGTRLLLAKAKQQEKRKDGRWPNYGAIEIHAVNL